MKLLGINIFGEEKNQKLISEPEALDGAEERKEPLSTISITNYIINFRELKSATYIHLISHELRVPEERVEEDIIAYLGDVDDDTICCLEYPYIEEYYRDTYYSFYSRKHNEYNRHCFRISFFTKDVSNDNFFTIDLTDKFLGYAVLRPTPRRIIGYSFLSPILLGKTKIAICICKRLISVMGRNLEVVGFPFLSFDGEAQSCSENSIILIFDYFSRRYNNYSRALPSQIANFTSNNYCRNQPSIGLTPDEVIQVFNNLGMTTRKYTRKDKDASSLNYEFAEKEFKQLLIAFVESGVPIYVSTADHAFLLIGRENKLFEQDAMFVTIDGNKKPYHFINEVNDVVTFIVPMPDNILLDAHLVKPVEFYNKIEDIDDEIKMLDDDAEYVHRIFLTTSRSFKKHIVNTKLSPTYKKNIVCTAMPKFIWVSESINKKELNKDINDIRVELIGVYDATDYPTERNHLLLAKSKDHLIIPTTDNSKLRRKTFSVIKCDELLHIFQFNLKGSHTKWQG